MITIGETGEYGVIEAIREVAPSARNGDDAAVLSMTTPNARYVATTDMLIQGRHFRCDWSTPEHIGAKAAVQNFADVEAMGARPTAILFGVSAPEDTPLDHIVGIARGLQDQCGRCAAEIVGGDVVGGDSLVISITAMGELGGPARPLARSGARHGENVIAAGHIGHSAAGLALLRRFGSRAAVPYDLDELVLAHLAPDFTYGRGPVARAAGAGSLTDNSDGLITDLNQIATASNVAIDLDRDALAPDELLIRAGHVLDTNPWDWVLNGGEDHTLLGTIAGAQPDSFRIIGSVTRGQPGQVTLDGEKPWLRGGWVSF
ncbi:thiamine-phosphate kinase [Corynebacterium sp. TAE3-ERU12]|uniref:thiamine-phosphate kinase n=1 Tax=Corynebacterium sp. TAE3-ERU12 TaxID=2849491 RepID=UPI001C457B83|nr:thiamine-phosphate kinase [Corynebacterium sp. TAE3-ERU12]MBV7295190.1 thiamine-phosphate kinase [Corynebacterium sp. TAE3-ERU12]